MKERAFQPGYFENLIRKYFLQNPTQLFFGMIPDSQFSSRLITEESDRLKEKVKDLSLKDKEDIHQKGLQLLAKQEFKDDLSVLPSLQISDINRFGKDYPVVTHQISTQNVQSSGLFRLTSTNGISYLKVGLSIDHIPEELQTYLPLFCSVRLYLLTNRHLLAWILINLVLNIWMKEYGNLREEFPLLSILLLKQMILTEFQRCLCCHRIA
jgi:Zn-dependent M16 (insulinase) family peptidase